MPYGNLVSLLRNRRRCGPQASLAFLHAMDLHRFRGVLQMEPSKSVRLEKITEDGVYQAARSLENLESSESFLQGTFRIYTETSATNVSNRQVN